MSYETSNTDSLGARMAARSGMVLSQPAVAASECSQGFRFPITECPNMKADPNDRSFEYEHYSCSHCGLTDKLDYEEMR